MGQEFQHHKTCQIRLSPSIRDHASFHAEVEGVSLNYFISDALAEKMKRLGTLQHDTEQQWLQESKG